MIWDQKIFYLRGFGATPVVFVLVPLVSLGGFLLFATLRNAQTPDIAPIAIQEHSLQKNNSVDSDQDGLKDWEEQIYTTDAHNADTDGDGANDGDEIAQNHDPLKKGPDDVLTKIDTSAITVASPMSNGKEQNTTQKIAEIFGEDYIMPLLQNSKGKPDIDATVEKMMKTVVTQATSTTDSITTQDIIIIHNASKEDMEQYLKQFGVILKNSLFEIAKKKKLIDSIAETFNEYQKNKSLPSPDALIQWINGYDQLLIHIKTLPVPEDFTSLHIEYINSAIKEREALAKIHGITSDVMLAIIGLKEYTQTTAESYVIGKKYQRLKHDKALILTHE